MVNFSVSHTLSNDDLRYLMDEAEKEGVDLPEKCRRIVRDYIKEQRK